MTGNFLRTLTALAIITISAEVKADSDEPPLYVGGNGVDSGACQLEDSPCRTIQYALRQVGKNGRIRVDAGTYELSDVADTIYLLSGAIDVQGSDGDGSTLVGVPQEFAAELAAKGFRVIVDSKGLNQAAIQTQVSLKSNAAATACVGGFAGAFPCNNVDLLAHIADRTQGARGADIWGFMDLNTHREYTIVGYSTGTAVYDVTDPDDPREVGFVNGQTTTWRDIKIHQFWNSADARWNAYAYITADNASDGLFIIDLSQLPHRIDRISYGSDFSSAHNVYLTDTDFSTGLSLTGSSPTLILAGSNLSDGRFRSYSLADPSSPVLEGVPATPAGQSSADRLYMHDAASVVVTDSRKDTQCVNAGGSDHCDILFDFNESTIDIWDVTDPVNPARLSQTSYSNTGYTHSGWSTEDQQFLFVQDETDERDRGLATTLRVFSISNLTAPALAGSWIGPTNAIDHNGFVRGNRYYMSNYARGLSILDITDAANPILAGRFDTYPASDSVGFPGNWGTYPFLPSGNIALSDIDSGFYLVADNTLDSNQGSLSFAAEAFGNDESQSINVVVQRSGNSQDAISVNWEIVGATADTDDLVNSSGTLNWADGDSSDQTINLGLVNDGTGEGLERVLVKLTAPTGGATLASPSISSAYISDPGDTSEIGFAANLINVTERGFGTAVAVIHRSGSAVGVVSVDYSVNPGDASNVSDYSGPATGTLTWASGDANPKWIEYDISDDGTAEPVEFFEIILANVSGGGLGANNLQRVNILDGDGSNNAPNSVAGATQTVNGGTNVTLDGSGSNDPNGDTLAYTWSQTLGPSVVLSNAGTSSASFVAPSVTSDTLLRFQLSVTDTTGLTDSSTANVTVRSSGGSSGGGTLDLLALLGLFSFLAVSRKGVS